MFIPDNPEIKGTITFLREVVNKPGLAPAGAAKLYIEDNSSGKTRLVVQFQSGATQVIATEP